MLRWLHRRLGHNVDWYGFGRSFEEGYCSCGRIWFRKVAL